MKVSLWCPVVEKVVDLTCHYSGRTTSRAMRQHWLRHRQIVGLQVIKPYGCSDKETCKHNFHDWCLLEKEIQGKFP